MRSFLLAALVVVVGAGSAQAAPVHGLGAIVVKHATARAPHIAHASGAPLASIDLTQFAVPVGYQGAVSGCVPWAVIDAMGYWENKEGIPTPGFGAPMFLFSQTVLGTDTGSTVADNLNLAMNQGVDNESDYPQGYFDWQDKPSSSEVAHAANWKIASWSEIGLDQTSIESALAVGYPTIVVFPVYSDFYTLPAGQAYPYEPSWQSTSYTYEGLHAVVALGYDATGVRIENSWGTNWGDAGYATITWSWLTTYDLEAAAVGPVNGPPPVPAPAPSPAPTPAPKPAKKCVVPNLKGMTLDAAQHALGRAGCALGKVKRPRVIHHGHKLHVVSQTNKPRSVHAVNHNVGVTMH